MKPSMLINFVLLYLPLNVFAYPGHVEWSQLSLGGLSERVEAVLVIAALAIYLIARTGKNRSVITRTHKTAQKTD